MLKPIFKILITGLFFISLFFAPPLTYGQGDIVVNIKQSQGAGVQAQGKETELIGNIFRNVIILFFAVGGIGFTIMILWGAVDWILSGGDKEKVSNARKRITQAIIGLVILSLIFVIMVVAGQITGISALKTGAFKIPGLADQPAP